MSASINQLIAPAASYVSRPRAVALIGGVNNGGLVSFEVDSANYARGDTFSLEIIPDVGATWFRKPRSRPLSKVPIFRLVRPRASRPA